MHNPKLRDYVQSDIHSIVAPSLQLCKMIPKDSFTNSKLVYEYAGGLYSYPEQNGWYLKARESSHAPDAERYPAPTLLEIMRDLCRSTHTPIQIEQFFAHGETYLTYKNTHYTFEVENPQDSALLAWFQIKEKEQDR